MKRPLVFRLYLLPVTGFQVKTRPVWPCTWRLHQTTALISAPLRAAIAGNRRAVDRGMAAVSELDPAPHPGLATACREPRGSAREEKHGVELLG